METQGLSNVVSLSRSPGEDYFDEEALPVTQETNKHKYEQEEAVKLFRKLRSWFELERERQSANRYQMALDEDFYDGLQWADDDALTLQERNQAPLVFNEIKPHVDWLIGTERRTRVDWRVDPRTEEASASAMVKMKVLKWVNDNTKASFARSRAFEECIKAGVGWLEEGVRSDPTDDPLYVRAESWRNIIYDSHGVEPDLSDSRYLFRWKWIDLDIALCIWPERKGALRRAAVAADQWGNDQDEDFWYLGQRFGTNSTDGGVALSRRTYVSEPSSVNNRRSRVKIYECWYREPVKTKKLRGGPLDGIVYREDVDAHTKAVDDGVASTYDAIHMQMKVCFFSDGGILHEQESPYEHDSFPFTPIWCYRRKRDNAPYGVVRNLRDPQEDLNKRASKALHILSTTRVVTDDPAADIEDLREEAARPDAILRHSKGSTLELHTDKDLAIAQVQLMDRDAAYIERTSGVANENLGRDTNAQSGKAVLAKQQQGAMVTAPLFDNLRYAFQIQGEKILSLCEQFYTVPKVIRITGEVQGKFEWVKINTPEVQPDGTVRFLNDVTASRDDFIVDEQDFSASLRQAMFEQLMEMISRMAPEMGVKLLHFAVDFSDLPKREEFVKELRKMAGYVPPRDAQTPEEAQAFQQLEAAQQEQAAFAKAMAQVELQDKDAAGKLKKAQAMLNFWNAQKAQLEVKRLAEGPDPAVEELQTRLEEAVNAQQQAGTDDARAWEELDRKDALAREKLDRETELRREKQDRDHELAQRALDLKGGEGTAPSKPAARPKPKRRTVERSPQAAAREPKAKTIEITDASGKTYFVKAQKGPDGRMTASIVSEDGQRFKINQGA